KFEFTNAKCTSLDKQFADFEYCYLKSVNRSYKYISVKCKLFQTPITQAKVMLSLFKRFNGYRPFMYNITVDACKFLEKPVSNPVVNYFYTFLTTHTNLNHTCPFIDDIVCDKLTGEFINYQITKVLPFPEGEYLLETRWIVSKIEKARLQIYGTLS
ncbi:hypothetical protein KR018_010742, partial [Drosophila ironensis]